MKHWIRYYCLFFVLGITAQNKTTYTYAIKGLDTLKLDVYTPKNVKSTDSLPVLLWMHGGGFSGGSRDNKDEQQLCSYAAKNGFVGISISYRLLRKGEETGFGCNCPKSEKLATFKQATIDYLDAARYIVSNAKNLHIDVTKIIAGGSSAGAEAVLNAVYMRRYFARELDKGVQFAGVFSLAGALVDASFITKENAIPTVLFHGTDDNLVPFGNAPHHYCKPSDAGYIFLDGSNVIVEKLKTLETAYYFHVVKGGKHELASIPFKELDAVFQFFEQTVFNREIIQTKIIKTTEE